MKLTSQRREILLLNNTDDEGWSFFIWLVNYSREKEKEEEEEEEQ